MMVNVEKIERVGVKAAYLAGKILNSHFGNLKQIEKKGAIDLVTVADIESERTILSTIREIYPQHAILAEESGMSEGSDQDMWIIDPLDGTTNFAHKLPLFAISIAYAHKGRIEVGIVFNPINGELFSAVRGRGARLNNLPIQVSQIASLQESLLVTGFPYRTQGIIEILVKRFADIMTGAQGVRRLGSAALDLCYVACGRFEGFWENLLKSWDTAAGMLIVQEAGGRITDFTGKPYDLNGVEILATNGYIHDELMAYLQ